ncbi:transmembrane signal receptor [Lithospermum erythrorhizon]|uniref:Transmembrane signal receptor n=1 Tax=Lithospermum erythrorhizon TaxID=34254 RepID=A0AAV3QCY8_LITER
MVFHISSCSHSLIRFDFSLQTENGLHQICCKIGKIESFFLCAKIFLLFQLLICSIQPASSSVWDGVIITKGDYEGLQALKHDLVDPNGFLKSWNDSGNGACSGSWVGIKCAQGQVIVIQLPWRGLSGRLSEKIGQFQALRKLSLHDNFIGGEIPTSLGYLSHLRGLQLYNNRFFGSIPPSLGSCPSLQTIDLGNNSLSGILPTSIANSTKLLRFNVSHNLLSGSIPISLTQSHSIIYLDLSFNGINGSLPDSLSNLTSLTVLNLEKNHLDGRVPESIKNLKNLTVLNLRNNQISGSIPATIGTISGLEFLDLSYNNLGGDIPESLGSLVTLTSFNVSYNNLSGPVPSRLTQKFNSTAFVGNLRLCGFSSTTACPISPAAGGPSSPSDEIPKGKHRKLSTKDIFLIAAGCLIIVLLVICCILCCCLIRKKASAKSSKGGAEAGKAGAAARAKKGVPPAGGEVEAAGETGGKLVHFDGPMGFTADDLLCATAEIMGKSTYGTVYKASFEDGNQVAVKRLREKITKGQKEFEDEVNVLGKIRHPNLLAMRAYYLGPKGEKLLVFDYLPKGSLASFLHARGPETPIDWSTRMKIIKGTIGGLLHLHTEQNMVHGNLTSSNILLDEQTNPKITDYGLSRLMTAAANSNVIATAGALGYRAPELSKLKKANAKTDVYSLGVIILELLTGKSPGEAMNGIDLAQWVASIVKEEWTNEVFDLELMRDASVIGDELLNTLKLALHCVDPSPSARPELQQVLQQLEEIRPETAASSGDEGFAPAPSASD